MLGSIKRTVQIELHLVGNVYPLSAGVPFDITQVVPEGVNQFSILGIDPSEGLDPTDPTAFVTGLTFVGGGNVANLTMTPVPEPSMLALLCLGANVLSSLLRRRYTKGPMLVTLKTPTPDGSPLTLSVSATIRWTKLLI